MLVFVFLYLLQFYTNSWWYDKWSRWLQNNRDDTNKEKRCTKKITQHMKSVAIVNIFFMYIYNVLLIFNILKLPSLFAAWFFWTFYNQSHNMKALVMHDHHFSNLFILKKNNFYVSLCSFLDYLHKKILPRITYANHMTMTTNVLI